MKYFLKIRIPTALGLFLLLVGVGATVFLSGSAPVLQTNASVDDTPRDIRITNVTDTTITISYTTSINVLGTIIYGESENSQSTLLDDRDIGRGRPTPHISHYFTLTDLRQDTEYFFTILSGSSTYLHNGKPFSVRTAQVISDTPSNQPQFSGTIVIPEGVLANEVILFLQSDTSQPVSTLIRPDTSYVISLANIRTADKTSFDTLTSESIFHLLFASTYGNSTAIIHAGQKSPLPPIVLSKNYDFTHTIDRAQPTQPTETFPLLNKNAVKGAKTIALPPKRARLSPKSASLSADTTVLGARTTAFKDAPSGSKNVSFATLPNPNTPKSVPGRSPFLLSGILGSIALGMVIFIVSFVRRVTS